jgi:hypothetical protein
LIIPGQLSMYSIVPSSEPSQHLSMITAPPYPARPAAIDRRAGPRR